MQEIKHKLESVFSRIENDRMQGVPVCNPALQVEAVGFRKWNEYYLGVMVTPWFMNLMLVPVEQARSETLQEGSKQTFVFPSGKYEFIAGNEYDLGGYQVCSLFSPMFDFESQSAVVETASEVLKAIMQSANKDTVSTHEKSIRELWQQEETLEEENSPVLQEADDIKNVIAEKNLEKPVSRREFLRLSQRGVEREREQDRGN